jgi:DNA-directed RNA polymerase specialized sigma24 family protein
VDPDDEAAYAEYVEQSWPGLVRAAVFLGARPHEAEDLAQATLVRCYTGWDKVAGADNRDVVVLRYFVQLTEKQTAEALGVPPGTVKSRLSRALAHLASNDHLLDLSRGGSR